MNKLSVSAIVSSKCLREVDVANFMPKSKQQFSVDKLIKSKEIRKNKILSYYVNTYNICLGKITQADSIGHTDIVYDVPSVVFGYYDYNPFECRDYVENKLRSIGIDTYKLSQCSLFISWHSLAYMTSKECVLNDKVV